MNVINRDVIIMDDNKLGKYVRMQRGDLSLRDYAKIVGISHTHLDSIEKGYDPRTGKEISPSLAALEKLASAAGKSISNYLAEAGVSKYDLNKIAHSRDLSEILADDNAGVTLNGRIIKPEDKKIMLDILKAYQSAKEK